MVVQLIAKSLAGPFSRLTSLVAQYLRFSTVVALTYQQASLVYLLQERALPSQTGTFCSFSEAMMPKWQVGPKWPARAQAVSLESAKRKELPKSSAKRLKVEGVLDVDPKPTRQAFQSGGQVTSGDARQDWSTGLGAFVLRYQCSGSTVDCIGLIPLQSQSP